MFQSSTQTQRRLGAILMDSLFQRPATEVSILTQPVRLGATDCGMLEYYPATFQSSPNREVGCYVRR